MLNPSNMKFDDIIKVFDDRAKQLLEEWRTGKISTFEFNARYFELIDEEALAIRLSQEKQEAKRLIT